MVQSYEYRKMVVNNWCRLRIVTKMGVGDDSSTHFRMMFSL